jgi:Sulfotransferase family
MSFANAVKKDAQMLAYMRRARWSLKRARCQLEMAIPPRKGFRAPAFIVGCGRSGTTLLSRILGRHPHILSLNEPRDRWFVIDSRTDEIGLYANNGKLGLGAADVTERAWKARHLIERPLGTRGFSQVVEKSPSNVFRLTWLQELYPDCRIINIVRDGRDVVRSIMNIAHQNIYCIAPIKGRNQWWGLHHCKRDLVIKHAARAGLHLGPLRSLDGERLDATAAALEWVISIDAVQTFTSHHERAHIIDVSYECLINDSRTEVMRILNFLLLEERNFEGLISIVRPCQGSLTQDSESLMAKIEPEVRSIFADRLRRLGYCAAAF